MAPGQQAFALIVAPALRHSKETFRYALGAAQAHPDLRKRIRSVSAESFVLERPDGIVTVECVPATAGGAALRGRSIVAAAMDECAFFRDDSFAVNDVEIFKAITPRVLVGGMVIIPSTPWTEKGLLYDLWKQNFGHPVNAIVAHAPTKLLRPSMTKKVEAQELLDPDNAAREYGAEFMSGSEGSFFEPAAIDLSVDKSIVLGQKPRPGAVVSIGADFAFQTDSSALVVTHQYGNTRYVADIIEMKPQKGNPLKPSQVVEKFANVAKFHQADAVVADGHYRESISELLSTYELGLLPAPAGTSGKALQYQGARTLFRDHLVRIPDDQRLLMQLREVEYRPTSGGGVSFASPRWRTGGHGDIVSALMLALYRFGKFDISAALPNKGTKEWYDLEEKAMYDQACEATAKAAQKGETWWDVLGEEA